MRIVTVVEKESDREALEKMIRKIGPGYETAGAASGGQEGYALIKEENPDLIIAETGLSRMDGLLMLKKLRREKMRTKVILQIRGHGKLTSIEGGIPKARNTVLSGDF